VITSTHNQRVVKAVRLKKRAMRERDRSFLVEGARAVGEGIASGLIREIFHSPDSEARLGEVLAEASDAGIDHRPVSPEVMSHLTSTVTPQGIVAVAGFVDVPLSELPAAGCVPILWGVRDPGNAGTILRSADAAGATAVIFTTSSVDVYNNKAVRASAGSLFHIPVVREVEAEPMVEHLRSQGFTVLAAAADGKASVYDADLTGPTAVLFGNEAQGLGADASALADHSVRVPIRGRAESLNLAAAAALIMFDAARQQDAGVTTGEGLAQIVAGAAHDIRSPLTALKGFVSTLLARWDRLSDEQRLMMLRGVANDGTRMGVIVSQLVDAARIRSGRLELAPVLTDLLEAARSVAEEMGEWAAVQVEVDGRAGRALVDPVRLRIIMVALIEAAHWWGEEGPVRIRVSGGNEPVLSVERSGSTLDEHAGPGLFRPRSPGTGGGSKVGLFVAKDLAEAMGARLSVQARPDVRFSLTLPGSRQGAA
jgi:RNA methyltransferase, TrmH family